MACHTVILFYFAVHGQYFMSWNSVNLKAVDHGQCIDLGGTPVISNVSGGFAFNHFIEAKLL